MRSKGQGLSWIKSGWGAIGQGWSWIESDCGSKCQGLIIDVGLLRIRMGWGERIYVDMK